MDITLDTLIKLLGDVGPQAVFILVIYGLLKRLIVPLETYLEMKGERDWWRKFALSLLDLSEQSVNVAGAIASKKRPSKGIDHADTE